MNKNIIIAILIVIIIAIGAVFVLGQSNGKMNTQITFKNDETFQNGEQVQFELKDSQGNVLSGKTVEITYNSNEKYTVTTDQNGKGYLTISGESAGKYDIEATFAGDDKYNGCNAKVTITITDDTPNNPGTQPGTAVATTEQHNNSNSKNSNTTPKNKSINITPEPYPINNTTI